MRKQKIYEITADMLWKMWMELDTALMYTIPQMALILSYFTCDELPNNLPSSTERVNPLLTLFNDPQQSVTHTETSCICVFKCIPR
jgi:hypothetical protein